MIRIDDRVWLVWALWILLLPLKWLLAAAAAACSHELCHLAAVYLLGGRVFRVTVGPFGAVIDTEGIGGAREGLCALAGPAGSLLLVCLIHKFPMLGLCGLVQGIFNLLPIYPMDGGRALLWLLEVRWPNQAGKIAGFTEIGVISLLFAAVVTASVRYSLGFAPVMLCTLPILNAIFRKRP